MKIDTLEAIFYTVLTSLLMSIGELTVFYTKISKDISSQINGSLKNICKNEKKINKILNKKFDKLKYSELLKIKQLQESIKSVNPTILKSLHKATEKPYIETSTRLNYLTSGVIVSVIIIILSILFVKIRAAKTPFNWINFIFFVISFLIIAGYQAFFTLKVALAPDTYIYASMDKEVIPEILNS